jgi:hypothetical protein
MEAPSTISLTATATFGNGLVALACFVISSAAGFVISLIEPME